MLKPSLYKDMPVTLPVPTDNKSLYQQNSVFQNFLQAHQKTGQIIEFLLAGLKGSLAFRSLAGTWHLNPRFCTWMLDVIWLGLSFFKYWAF